MYYVNVQYTKYEIKVIFRRKNKIMRSGSGVVPYFIKLWEQSIIGLHGQGCYEWPESVSGE